MHGLKEFLDHLESDPSLREPRHLRKRIEALDTLDVFNLDIAAPDGAQAALYARAGRMQANLEAVNSAVYESILHEIRAGRGASTIRDWLTHLRSNQLSAPEGEGYDYLDEFVAGILQFGDPGSPTIEPSAEMVFYQPTPARHIFDLLDRAALTANDVLIDLGSGLGHVPLLTSICTDAHAIGVELEPAYVETARECAKALNLPRTEFVQQDARIANLSHGTLFYLYTPFRGIMLQTMLDLLRGQAIRREIRVSTFGPCTAAIASEGWLEALGPWQMDRVSMFRSKRF